MHVQGIIRIVILPATNCYLILAHLDQQGSGPVTRGPSPRQPPASLSRLSAVRKCISAFGLIVRGSAGA